MTYTICFDFPERDAPLFAGRGADGVLGFAPSLATAETFDSEAVAERTLLFGYGREYRLCGAVVEVAA